MKTFEILGCHLDCGAKLRPRWGDCAGLETHHCLHLKVAHRELVGGGLLKQPLPGVGVLGNGHRTVGHPCLLFQLPR